MTDEEIIKTSLYIPRGLLKRLKDAAFQERSTVNAVVSSAAETWLSCRGFFEQAATAAHVADKAVRKILGTGENQGKPNDTQGDPDIVIKSANRVTPIPEEFRPWVLYLLHILEADNQYASPSIKKNLEAFARLTELDGGQNAPPTGDPERPRPDGRPSADRALQEASDLRRDAARIDKEHQTKRGPRRKDA